jgi:hypothetical protein
MQWACNVKGRLCPRWVKYGVVDRQNLADSGKVNLYHLWSSSVASVFSWGFCSAYKLEAVLEWTAPESCIAPSSHICPSIHKSNLLLLAYKTAPKRGQGNILALTYQIEARTTSQSTALNNNEYWKVDVPGCIPYSDRQ